MTRTRKVKSTEYVSPNYSLHDPHKPEISRQQQDKRFEKLKKLLAALPSDSKIPKS